VLLSLLIGPSAAHPDVQKTGIGGYADILNVQTMTVPSLAFAATLVGPFRRYDYFTASLVFQARFALSTESNCHWTFTSGTPGFNNISFYQQIISTVESWKEEECQSLLMWWNRCAPIVFLPNLFSYENVTA